MGRASAVSRGSVASVVFVVMAVVVRSGVMAVQADDVSDICLGKGSDWYERDVTTGRWLSFSSAKIDSTNQQLMTHLPWSAIKEEAQKQSAALGNILPQDGLPMPMMTCHTHSTHCHEFSHPDTPCTRVSRRAFCVRVGGECQSLVVSMEEPIACCCGGRRNATLTGRITNMWVKRTCPPASGEIEDQGRGGGVEEKPGVKESAALHSLSEELPDADDLARNITSEEEKVEAKKEFVKDTILDDMLAAAVFLFVGAMLVLLKVRVFKFTKKKKQEEDNDTESEDTLVDETNI